MHQIMLDRNVAAIVLLLSYTLLQPLQPRRNLLLQGHQLLGNVIGSIVGKFARQHHQGGQVPTHVGPQGRFQGWQEGIPKHAGIGNNHR